MAWNLADECNQGVIVLEGMGSTYPPRNSGKHPRYQQEPSLPGSGRAKLTAEAVVNLSMPAVTRPLRKHPGAIR